LRPQALSQLLALLSEITSQVSSHCEHDGWKLEEWAAWGKKKGRIASEQARENGKLKERLESANERIARLEETNKAVHEYLPLTGTSVVDPLAAHDPWLLAARTRDVTDNHQNDEGVDLWATWNQNVDAAQSSWSEEYNICEINVDLPTASQMQYDWRPLPVTAWRTLHSTFHDLNGQRQLPTETSLDEDGQELLEQSTKYHQQELVRRIRTIKCHGWDSLGDGQLCEGDFVLADSALSGDLAGQRVAECARGVIVKRTEDSMCQIAFLNKGHDCLTWATLQLPDDRVLHPVPDGYSDYSD
jgi:hypothetical protein